jgi:hypothetical protein
MSSAYILEVRSTAVELVVREREGFRFFSPTNEFAAREGQSVHEILRSTTPPCTAKRIGQPPALMKQPTGGAQS